MRLQTQRFAGDPATVAAAVRDAALVLVAVQQVDQRVALDRERPAPSPSEVAELRDAARAAGARLAGLTDGGSAVLLEYLRATRAHLAGQAGARDAIHLATHQLWNCFDRPIAALVGFCANADVDLTRSLDAPGQITLCSTDDFIVCCCRLAEQGAYADLAVGGYGAASHHAADDQHARGRGRGVPRRGRLTVPATSWAAAPSRSRSRCW